MYEGVRLASQPQAAHPTLLLVARGQAPRRRPARPRAREHRRLCPPPPSRAPPCARAAARRAPRPGGRTCPRKCLRPRVPPRAVPTGPSARRRPWPTARRSASAGEGERAQAGGVSARIRERSRLHRVSANRSHGRGALFPLSSTHISKPPNHGIPGLDTAHGRTRAQGSARRRPSRQAAESERGSSRAARTVLEVVATNGWSGLSTARALSASTLFKRRGPSSPRAFIVRSCHEASS